MIVKKILFIFIVTAVQRCWTCKSKNEKESLSSDSQKSFGRSNDYGFYLGDFIEETVMNGEETEPHQYPWMVFVCGKFDLNTMKCTESCGGSLIHRKYVLTAAHCVAGGKTDDTFIITGAHNVKTKMDMYDFVYLDDIILHPEYNPNRETSEDKLLEATVKIRSNSWCKKRRNLRKYIKR